MNDFQFNQEEYLQRINYKGSVSNTFECLKALHHAQHTIIPFENFDICLGKAIHLEPEAIFEKLVKNKRGGYCFELNGLLLMALQSFGFEARALLGRVHIKGKPTGRGHFVSLVTINEQNWIVDSGFGGESPRFPMPFICDEVVTSGNQTLRFIKDELFGYMLQGKKEDEWINMYSIELNHVCQGDIDYGNHFTSTSPKSFFTTSRVAALPTENGMITLLNHNLKKVINGVEENILLEEDETYLRTIEKEFGIVIDAKIEDLKPVM